MNNPSTAVDPVPFVPLTDDRLFRSVFADPRHTDLLAAFLQTVLDLPDADWESLTVTDTHTPPERDGAKEVVLDVKVLTGTGTTVAVEVQVRPATLDRFVYYTAKNLTRQLVSGEDYRDTGRAVTVVITRFVLFDHPTGYHHVVELHHVHDGHCQGRVTDAQVVHLLQLPALGDDDGTEAWQWLRAFAATSWEEMAVAGRTDADIARVAALVELYASQAAEDAKDAHDKWLWDQTWREDTARAQGHEQGLVEGETQALHKTALKALHAGLPVEQVAQITGLTCDEIRHLDAR